MKRIMLGLVATAAMLSSMSGAAAPGTWTGTISDSGCGASHDAMTEHGKKGNDKQCTQMCLMKGAKYVFVNEGKVLMIKNQDLADLKKYAGDRVTISGDLMGDTITVAKIAAAK
jgi:hypothetical protein